jgi:ferrous iron transport protein A
MLKTWIKEELIMMPLTFATVGEENTIVKIGGKPEVKKHLENLGFVVGGTVKVVSAMGGNLIVNVKEARVGISQEMAQKIMI